MTREEIIKGLMEVKNGFESLIERDIWTYIDGDRYNHRLFEIKEEMSNIEEYYSEDNSNNEVISLLIECCNVNDKYLAGINNNNK